MKLPLRFIFAHAGGMALLCLLALVCTGPLRAQFSDDAPRAQFSLQNWRSHTSMVNARDAVSDTSGRLWVATGGGIFSVQTRNNEFRQLRNTEGLLSLDVTSLAFHARTNTLFAGTFDGYIEALSLYDFRWRHILDIQAAASTYPRRSIHHILFRGDTALLATDFGVALFDIRRGVFIETVDRIGAMDQKTAVWKLLLTDDSLIVATDGGVYAAPLATPTLRVPDIWKRMPVRGGDTLRECRDVCRTATGRLFACNASGIYEWKQDTFRLVRTQSSPSSPHTSLADINGNVYYATRDRIARIDESDAITDFPSVVNGITAVRLDDSLRLGILYFTRGVGIAPHAPSNTYVPNSMYSNRVQRVCVDAAGRAWTATSNRNLDGQGISCFDGSTWFNANSTLVKAFPGDASWRISATPDSSVWASTWGDGILECTLGDSGIVVNRYTSTNSLFTGISGSANYVLGGDAAGDRNRTSWIVNFDPTNGPGPLFVSRDVNGAWKSYTNETGSGRSYVMIGIDAADTKWAAGPSGLVWFNERSQGSRWGRITSANSTLTDNDISAFAVDKNGMLWMGSGNAGISVISFPSLVLRPTSSVPGISRLRLLRDQVINDIIVDPQNNKWIATNTGVWILTDDGGDTIGYINKKRYPALLSDEIKSLALDPATGTVYIGTVQGLNSVQTLSIQPAAAFSLNAYPQPFHPASDPHVVIDGLEADVRLKITTLDGVLVRSLETMSRKALWDGRDEQGEYVNSGVYLALAVSQSNTTTAVTKILVVRK